MTRPDAITQRDLARIFKAAKAAGVPVRITTPQGVIVETVAETGEPGLEYDPYLNGVRHHAKGRRRAVA